MKKRIVMICSLAVTAVLVILLAAEGIGQNRAAENYSAMIEQIKPLDEEKMELHKRLETLEKEYEENIKAQATLELLFTSADREIYTELFPEMKKNSVAGIIALSDEELPNMEGNFIRREFEEMLNEGWSYCLSWNGDGDLESFLNEMEDTFYNISLTMPKAIYFEPGTYSSSYSEILEAHGFNTAVHHGEENLPIIVSGGENEIWEIGAYSFEADDSLDYLEDVRENKGNCVCAVSGQDGLDIYEMFKSYISVFKSGQDKELYKITTFGSARTIHSEASEAKEQYSGKYESEKADLEKRIYELDEQIKDIYYSSK